MNTYYYRNDFAIDQSALIQAAYQIFENIQASKPPLTSNSNQPLGQIQKNWTITKFIFMQDFIFSETENEFYGFIAERKLGMNLNYVMAIRGTSTLVEWLDDVTAIEQVAFNPNDVSWGNVGFGFNKIYKTLYTCDPPENPDAILVEPCIDRFSKDSFEKQVLAHINERVGIRKNSNPNSELCFTNPKMAVTGHSLGAALMTLYVAKNDGLENKLDVDSIYTFASPRVGDANFAGRFNELCLDSWRIVNDCDLIPLLPLGYTHVNAVQSYDPLGKVWISPECSHSIDSYRYLIDPTYQLTNGCAWPSI